MKQIIDINGLRVTGRRPGGAEMVIVDGVDLSVARGEVLALIGESGSGKTTIALAMMGYARRDCRIAGGSIRVAGHEIHSMDQAGLRRLRGRTIGYVAQSAAASFNPARTIMSQVLESARLHRAMLRPQAEQKAVALFRLLALPDPEGIGRRYPHEVSGGQLQRLLAAMALIADPEVVIFDEPTTALDVTTQIEVLAAFKSVVRSLGITGVYVSHDLAVVAQVADRVVVLRQGRVQEMAPIRRLLAEPAHDYTRALLAAAEPAHRPPQPERMPAAPLIEVSGLVAGYGPLDTAGRPRTVIVDGVGLTLGRGETLGIIGESGSGKSTLARAIAGFLAPSQGSVSLGGIVLAPRLEHRSRDQLRRIQMVFQSADTALNPRTTVGATLGRPLAFYRGLSGRAQAAEVARLLDMVRLSPDMATRLPGELSGGQKQRVNFARALAARPDLILCDEITSALDTVVARAVLDLMLEMQRELGVSYIFITHGLNTLRAICDRVMVLYAGHAVETFSPDSMAGAEHHPYTTLLTGSVPELRPGWLEDIRGERNAAATKTQAAVAVRPERDICSFVQRCDLRIEPRCLVEPPPVWESPAGATILCHRHSANGGCR